MWPNCLRPRKISFTPQKISFNTQLVQKTIKCETNFSWGETNLGTDVDHFHLGMTSKALLQNIQGAANNTYTFDWTQNNKVQLPIDGFWGNKHALEND